MKNFVQPGNVIDMTATGAVTSGQLVVVGALAGVAQTDAATGELFAAVVEGVVSLPKAGVAFAVGDVAYAAAGIGSTLNATNTNTRVGVVVAAAASGDANVTVKLG